MSKKSFKEFEETRQKILEAQRLCAWCSAEFSNIDELIDHLYIEQSTQRYGYLVEELFTSD